MLISMGTSSGDLRWAIHKGQPAAVVDLVAPGVIETNQWCHIALVTGLAGTKLYFNGILVAASDYQGSFAATGNGDHNYLGKSNWPENPTFAGQMDEIRVWATPRSEDQIRQNMFQRLSGVEEGLVGLWNFDDPNSPGRDATPNHFDAALKDNAQSASAPLPAPTVLGAFTLLRGKVRDAKGDLMIGANIKLEREGQAPRVAVADGRGEYRLLLSASAKPCSLSATAGTLALHLTNLVFRTGETNLNLMVKEFSSLSGKVLAFDNTPLEAVVVQAIGIEKRGLVAPESGFQGEYFRLQNLADFPVIPAGRQPDLKRTDPVIDFADITSVVPGTTLRQNFYVRWSGTIRLQRDQAVTFWLRSDDGSRLFLDGQLLVDNGGIHPPLEKSGNIMLPAGGHDLRVEFFQGGGPFGCRLFWSGDDLPAATNFVAKPTVVTTYTDNKGEYRFAELLPGKYNVRVHVPGDHVYAAAPDPTRGGPSAASVKAEGRSKASPAVWGVVPGKEITGVDFQIAPFKKGTWKTFTRVDGLAHDQILGIHETQDGVMWFATLGGGASRWDGRKFVNYTKAETLLIDRLQDIAEDAQGGLWFNDWETGVSRWDGRRFTRYTDTNGLPHRFVSNMKLDREGHFWLATSGGAARWTGSGFEVLNKANGLPNDEVIDVLQTRDRRFWFATPGGLAVKQGTNFVTYTVTNGLLADLAYGLLESRDGAVWFYGKRDPRSYFGPGFLTRFDGTNFTHLTQEDGLPDSAILSLAEDGEGNIWFGTSDTGVWRWDGTSLINYTPADGLAGDRVQTLHQDRNGVMWFGTFTSGLSRFNPTGVLKYSKADGLVDNSVNAVVEDRKGRVWIGTDKGVSVWDGRKFTSYTTADGLAHNHVTSVAEDKEDGLWFGTSGGLSRWDGEHFRNYTVADGLVDIHVLQLLVDRKGALWIGTDNGLSRWDGQRFENYTTRDGLVGNYLRALAEDREANLWFGTRDGGLSRWDGARFVNYGVANGLPSSDVLSVLAAADGTLWMGHDVVGVSHMSGTNVLSYSPSDGLGGSFSWTMAQDREGVLWFAHAREVSLFDGMTWSSIGPAEGLGERDTREIWSICHAKDGSTWIGSTTGLYRYRKGRALDRRPSLQVKADRDFLDLATIPEQKTGNRLTFNFGYVDRLTRPEKQQFRYQVVSGRPTSDELRRNTNWSKPMKSTEVDWTTNAPGHYTFAVQYINQDLRYSEPTLATFTLKVPWHADARIMVPAGTGILALFCWTLVARSLYLRKRREAERLREQLFEEEHRAREAAEKARAEIEGTNAELAKAKAAADQASQAKSQFLASMSHELRTPLTAIIGFSEMLIGEARSSGAAEQAEDLTRINDSANHLLGLINGILDLSKIEAQKMELHLETFDVELFVRDVTHTIKPLVDRKGNQLLVECPPDIGSMRSDLVKVRQCLFNLLGNANKFTEKGTVRLVVSRQGSGVSGDTKSSTDHEPRTPDTVHFTVIDTGIGITREQMARLFQAFSQADASTARKYGGTGLGLTITKHFCEMIGGSIRVESEPGNGSAFTMELPLLAPAPKTEPHWATSAPTPLTTANGKCVLVIDDDPNVHRLIERTLKDEGVTLWFASNAEEGLRLARELRPAAITLDVMMPGTDGWSVLSSLKSDPELAKIPVVMLTISSETEFGFALGASEYLVKPIDRNLLILTLKRYLADGSPGRVLIVEDDRSLRDLLRRMLETEKWAVDEADNGAAAMEKIRAVMPSVILLDLMLPVMDGFQVLAELHQHDDWRKIPVVVITAMDLSQADRARLQQQTEKIFEKGTRLQQELLREVRSCLDQYRAHETAT